MATCLWGPHDGWSAVVRDHQRVLEERGCLATGVGAQWAVTHPLLPPFPPPYPRSRGQPVTHPAGSSPETPLPRAGPAWSLPVRGGSDSLLVCLCVPSCLCLVVSFPVSLPPRLAHTHSLSLWVSGSLSLTVSPSFSQDLCSSLPSRAPPLLPLPHLGLFLGIS